MEDLLVPALPQDFNGLTVLVLIVPNFQEYFNTNYQSRSSKFLSFSTLLHYATSAVVIEIVRCV